MSSIEELYRTNDNKKVELQNRLEEISKIEYQGAMRIVHEITSAIIANAIYRRPEKCNWVTIGGKEFVCWNVFQWKDDNNKNIGLLSDGRLIEYYYTEPTEGTWRLFTPNTSADSKYPYSLIMGHSRHQHTDYESNIHSFRRGIIKCAVNDFGVEAKRNWFDSELEQVWVLHQAEISTQKWSRYLEELSKAEYNRIMSIIEEIVATIISTRPTQTIKESFQITRGNAIFPGWTICKTGLGNRFLYICMLSNGELVFNSDAEHYQYQPTLWEPLSFRFFGYDNYTLLVCKRFGMFSPIDGIRIGLLMLAKNFFGINIKRKWLNSEAEEINLHIEAYNGQ